MVVDSSALLAVFFNEAEQTAFSKTLLAAESVSLSAATLVELSVVVIRRIGDAGLAKLDVMLDQFDITVIPVDHQQALLARDAFRRFGKGRHPAGLNFGDCFAYALARQLDEPLLCKGDDFPRTDLALASAG